MRVAAFAIMVGASAWSDGHPMSCGGLDANDDEVVVTWTIPEGPGPRGVELLGCHDWTRELSAERATLSAGWRSCSLRAWRQDGALRVLSTPVTIDGDETSMHVDFDLPEGPIGGMGAEVRSWGHSVRIERVLPGTPADRAGFEAGQRVVAVDGVPTTAMSTSHFVRAVTGSPGTAVTLTLEADGGRLPTWAVIYRERIPEDRLNARH